MTTRNILKAGTLPLRHERGAVLVMTSLMLAILLGVAAFAIDVGYMYAHREDLRNATDSAAIAAALAVKQVPTITQSALDGVALAEAQSMIGDLVAADITVTKSPSTANGYEYDYSGDSTAVGVTITQNRSTFFSRILAINDMDITNRAVANTGLGAPGLIYVLKKTGTGLSLSGGSDLTVNGSIMVNSTGPDPINVGGNSYITAEGIGVAASNFVCVPPKCDPAAESNMPPGEDPLASLPPPSYGGCTYTTLYIPPEPPTGQTTTIYPGVYCGGIKISGNKARVKFNSGDYIIMKGLEISQKATVTGTGVMIYNTGNVTLGGVTYPFGAFVVSQTDTSVNLTGVSGGIYNGILFFQDRNNPLPVDFGSGASVTLNGIIYINKQPGATWCYNNQCNSDLALSFQSNSITAANEYTLLVVWSVNFGGGPNFTMNSSFTDGQSPLKHVSLVE